jgi:hypothetical protein
VFALVGLVPAIAFGIGGLRKLGRSRTPAGGLGASTSSLTSTAFGGSAPQPDAILGAYGASAAAPGPTLRPTGSEPAARPATPIASAGRSNDALDKIARLSELHKSGALTDEEFNREKSKLLAEL